MPCILRDSRTPIASDELFITLFSKPGMYFRRKSWQAAICGMRSLPAPVSDSGSSGSRPFVCVALTDLSPGLVPPCRRTIVTFRGSSPSRFFALHSSLYSIPA